MEIVAVISSSAVAIAAIAGLVATYFREIGQIRERLTALEVKVEPLWQTVQRIIPDFLMGQQQGNPDVKHQEL